jgi:hypothetical protein
MTVEKRPGIAVEIADEVVIVLPKYLAMHGSNVRINQLRLRGPAAANEQRLRGGQRENTSLIGPGQDQ